MTDLFHATSSEADVLDLFGVHIRILMPSAITNGALGMFDDHNEPGAGPPLHVHHDADEIFTVISGAYQFVCNGKVITAVAGDVVLVPRGEPHTFINCGPGPGHLLVTMQPGGFEGFFRELANAKLDVPRDLAAIEEIGRRFHLEFLGPNPLAK